MAVPPPPQRPPHAELQRQPNHRRQQVGCSHRASVQLSGQEDGEVKAVGGAREGCLQGDTLQVRQRSAGHASRCYKCALHECALHSTTTRHLQGWLLPACKAAQPVCKPRAEATHCDLNVWLPVTRPAGAALIFKSQNIVRGLQDATGSTKLTPTALRQVCWVCTSSRKCEPRLLCRFRRLPCRALETCSALACTAALHCHGPRRSS